MLFSINSNIVIDNVMKILIQLDSYKAKNLSGIFNDVDVAQFMLDCF